jgi:hypothetical protein
MQRQRSQSQDDHPSRQSSKNVAGKYQQLRTRNKLTVAVRVLFLSIFGPK